jgi:hypothetical protein
MESSETYYALEIYFEKQDISYIFIIPISKYNFVFYKYFILMNILNLQTQCMSPSEERIFFNPIQRAPFSLQHIQGVIHFTSQILQLHTKYQFYILTKSMVWPFPIDEQHIDIDYIHTCTNCNAMSIFETWMYAAVRIKPV